MNKVFNLSFQKFMPYIITILLAYFISTIIFLFLPKNGEEFDQKNQNELKLKKYTGFYSNINKSTKEEKKDTKKSDIQTLSLYQLKAIYSTQSNGGWVIIEKKDSNKSIILAKNENLDDYVLTRLYKKFIIFEKDSKEYKLELTKEKDIDYEIEKTDTKTNEKIVVNDGSVSVNRTYLNSYIKDLDKVWNNIAIKDIRSNGKIEGFKIDSVNEDSAFGKLGLKQNDIIRSVNGQRIRSYADAFKIYNNINQLDFLSLEIMRNNEIVELNYEIN